MGHRYYKLLLGLGDRIVFGTQLQENLAKLMLISRFPYIDLNMDLVIV